ncbi:S8 family serine peptidase [Natronospira bacteriovora]|uniref:S8 family serine peptidase n=1 Tax=Natronospira bacteriovora TaxID=3069753 RepID=A0ABU0W9M5_9GAMM|nr:S8 family serine peptidase [Natronospira sp. AB-CW4]MDQ2070613.1 S8 family serine peptidase [Natronospira sp. AB-CW4]
MNCRHRFSVLLCLLTLAFAAQAEPVQVRHLLGEVSAEEISAGWETEQALYLVRLESPPLAAHQARQAALEKMDGGATAPLGLQSERSQNWLAHLDAERRDFLARAAEHLGRPLQPAYVYRLANHGFAAAMTPAEAEQLAHVPGVRAIQRDHELELATDAGPQWIGATSIWEGTAISGMEGFEGEGIVFAIIDTGINYSNPSFEDQGHSNPLGDGVFLGDCAAGEPYENYCNNKLIGVRGYSDIAGGDPVDTDGHGSHVAGTAAGNPVTLEVGDSQLEISGVAPRANIISYNACCTFSALNAAIEDIVADYDTLRNADPDVRMVANYSIGASTQVSPWERFDGTGFLNARAAGIFVAVAAGNTGPLEATLWTPAVAPWVATVANSSHDRRILEVVVSVTGPEPVPESLEGMEARVGEGPDVPDLDGEDAVWAGEADPGNELACDPFPGNAFDGAIAVVVRGECNFSDKVNHADDAGAIAVVVINNEPGPPVPMGMADAIDIPAVMISQEDGENVIDWLLEHDNATLGMESGGIVIDSDFGDRLNPSSSRGPATVAPGALAPDLAAPGTDILAAYGSNNEITWSFLTGTSMASPHVAGAAGLLMGVHPDWSEQEIQSAMMLTAHHELREWDGTDTTPYGVGAGRVDLERAARAPFLLDETAQNFEDANPAAGGDPASLNLASLDTSNCDNSCTLSRTIRSPGGGSFTVSFEVPDGLDVSVNVSNNSFAMAPGDVRDLEFSFDNIYDAESRFGYVVFEDDGDGPTVRMPIVLGNLFVNLEGIIQGLAQGRPADLILYREGDDGPEIAEVFSFIGSGGDVPFLLALNPAEHYPMVTVEAPGYEIAVADNNGEGWSPEAGETLDSETISLQRLPISVSPVTVEDVTRTSGRAVFNVGSNLWPFSYRADLYREGQLVAELERDVVTALDETTQVAIDLEDLACSSELTVELFVTQLGSNADNASGDIAFSTRSCFEGGGGIGCTAGDSNRLDPVIPVLFMLALIGLAGRLRRYE